MFTIKQYDAAINALVLGKLQLEPDGKECTICGGNDHQAFECGMNPLLAMAICKAMSEEAAKIDRDVIPDNHKIDVFLDYLTGTDRFMGLIAGPANIIVPEK